MDYEDHPLLPLDAPQGQPHIIKDGQQDSTALNSIYSKHSKPADLCDFFVTVLHRLEGHSTALENFFDPTIRSFKFLRVEKKGGCQMSSMIWRKENEVLVSQEKQISQK